MEKCQTCGSAKECWELRCTRCAMASRMSDDGPILLVGPSQRYRSKMLIASLAGLAAVGTIVYLGEASAIPLSPSPFLRVLLTIIATALFLFVVIIMLGYLAAVYFAYDLLRSNAIYAVSKTMLTFDDIFNDYDDINGEPPTSSKFIHREIKLKSVRRICVKEDWPALWFCSGDVEIYADQSDKPAMIIPGVVNPHIFREKFDLLLKSYS
jgi:hypothetical protein